MKTELWEQLYEMAKKYRNLNWSLIPLYNYAKNPSPLNWKPYQDRRATDEEFEQWFNNRLLTGIGLITGKISGIIVLDEDLYKEGGIRVSIKTGMLAKTGRGGNHHYFRNVEPIKSSGFRQGINVEIKSDGGFVVLPPSQVKNDGVIGTYEWIEKCMQVDLLEITEKQLAPYRGENEMAVNLAELASAPEGTRHNNLRSMALSSFARFRPQEWGLAENIVRYLASQFTPPHPITDVERIIKDAEHFIQTHNKQSVQKEIDSEPVLPNNINDLVKQRIEDKKLEAMAPKTGWPELDRIIKGFIPGHVYTLTGDVNVGKSSLAANFAEALRKDKKKTLYIALEPDVVIVDYLASVRLRKQFNELTYDDLSVTEGDEYIQIYTRKEIREIQDLVRAVGSNKTRFDLIIIDHIGYFVRTEKDWIQQQGNVIKELAFLAKEYKTAIMMIAHLRKPGKTTKEDVAPTHDDISGSGAFKQDSTDVLIVHRPKEEIMYGVQHKNKGVLLVTKTKSGPNGGLNLLFPEKSAKIWSEEELASDEPGKKQFEQQDEKKLSLQMLQTHAWEQKEKDPEDEMEMWDEPKEESVEGVVVDEEN